MALDAFGFLFTGRGLDPDRDRSVIERDGFRAVMVGMADPSQAPEVAAAWWTRASSSSNCAAASAPCGPPRSSRPPSPVFRSVGGVRARVDRRRGGTLPAAGGLSRLFGFRRRVQVRQADANQRRSAEVTVRVHTHSTSPRKLNAAPSAHTAPQPATV